VRERRLPSRLDAHWRTVVEHLRTSRRIVLFLDFDGTLARIQPKPHMARLPLSTKQSLRRLARHPRVRIVVISGRRRADIQRRVGLSRIQYLGLYGNEGAGPLHVDAATVTALERIREVIETQIEDIRGVWVEDKGISLAVHLKNAPESVANSVRRQVRSLVDDDGSLLGMLENLRDIEIVPRDIGDKGTVVRRLLAQPDWRDAFAMYFGDDLSDESGFAAVERGVAVLVAAPRLTRAQYVVDGTTQVAACLRHMELALHA